MRKKKLCQDLLYQFRKEKVMIEKIMILYFSGMDHRRVNKDSTPYLYGLTEKYPMIKINTTPDVDMKTTMWSGRYPHEHGMWQAKLKEDIDLDRKKAWDYLPDIFTITFQCFLHSVTGKFDFAGIPDRRRRRFDIQKSKYWWKGSNGQLSFNGIDTIFKIIGDENCNFGYEDKFESMIGSLSKEFISSKKLNVMDGHGMDHFMHWNIDNEEKMEKAYKKVDETISNMHRECEKRGISVMVLSDHGHAKVEDTIDIKAKIEELGIKDNEISYLIEASKARFWFHSDNARNKMLNYLSENDRGTLLHFEELYRYNIKFDDDSFGEYYFITDPGTIFFPTDFYHPLGNIILGLSDKNMNSRLSNPVYRSYHGHLPHHECEKGFIMLLDDDYRPDRKEIDIIDVAPTVLNLLGYEKPPNIIGKNAYNL